MSNSNLNGRLWSESDNVGKLMITKLGWQQGAGLGKQGQGTTTHVKVSLKSGRDGIGMKNGKTNNNGLLQTFDYDMLLKTKYAEANGNQVQEEVPRSMSRAKFGRAVRPDFYKPLNNDDWTKILGSDKNNKEEEASSISKSDIKSETTDSKFVTNKVNINEYFEMQMKQKLERLKNANNLIHNASELKVDSSNDLTTDDESQKNRKEKKEELEDSETNNVKGCEKEGSFEKIVIDNNEKVKKDKRNKKIKVEEIVVKNEILESDNLNKSKSSRKRKRDEKKNSTETNDQESEIKVSKNLELVQKLSGSQLMLNEVDHLLKTEPDIPEKKLKQIAKVVELFDDVIVNAAKKMEPLSPKPAVKLNLFDTSNLKDIKGYKYYK